MIQLICASCKTLLSIDDAFAGGVCRCQHCGAIQTVPAGARAGNGRPNRVGAPVAGSAAGPDLSDSVTSTGLASSGLASSRLLRPDPAVPPSPAPEKRPIMLLLVLSLLVLLLLALAWIWA